MKTTWLSTSVTALIAGCLGVGGCAGSGSTVRTGDDATVAVPSDHYDTTFNAARRVLRDRGFILERVDAQEGVITTRPKTTAGVVTPWDREQQSVSQELEDLFERQQRVVRITFEPEAGGTVAEDGAGVVPVPAGDRVMHVQVTVQRVHLPGRRLEPEAISQTSYTWDPVLGERGMQPGYAVAYKGDRMLAERLAGLIEQQARDGGSPETVASTAEPAAPAPAEPVAPAELAKDAPAPAPPVPELPSEPAAPAPRANPWVEGTPLKKP